MADDLSNAPQTGGSEPVATNDAPSSASSGDKSAPAEKVSLRDTLQAAMKTVESRTPNETDKAAAVLKAGSGADDAVVSEHDEAVQTAQKALDSAKDASERAKRGWETRKANEAKAADEAKTAETIDKTVAAKVAEATAKVEPAKVEDKAQPASDAKFKEPPQRFTQQAKAEWEKVPEPVKAEIDRSLRELQQGIDKYKGDADKWTPLADYEKRSQEVYKQPLTKTLENYVQLDEMLATDPLAALERIVSNMTYEDENGEKQNWTLKQMAQYIAEQDTDTFQNPQADLQRELAAVRRELAEVKSGFTDRQKMEAETRTKSVESQVEAFAKSNPRFDELFPDMELILSSPKFQRTGDPVADLKTAYEKAERLNPAPSLSAPAPDLPARNTAAQTRNGTASVTGAPSSGSNPAKKPAPTSTRDALKAAFAAKGLAL